MCILEGSQENRKSWSLAKEKLLLMLCTWACCLLLFLLFTINLVHRQRQLMHSRPPAVMATPAAHQLVLSVVDCRNTISTMLASVKAVLGVYSANRKPYGPAVSGSSKEAIEREVAFDRGKITSFS